MDLKRLGQRICGGLVALGLIGMSVPTALAAPPAGVDIYSNNYEIRNGEISTIELDKSAHDKLTPGNSSVIGTTSATTLDLWVSSTDMSGDDYQIPYVIDGSSNKWYLQEIVLYDIISERNFSQILMTAEDISKATSKEDYTFNVADINIDPCDEYGYSWYDLCYAWTNTPPDQWGSGDKETYTVTYDLGIPAGVTSIFPITEDKIHGNESSGSYNYINTKVTNLTSTKLEAQNFAVADGLYIEGDTVWTGFFGYDWKNPDTTNYYYFDGWKADGDTSDKIYKTGDPATATSALAGDDKTIRFTGVWKEVPKWTEDQLAKAEQEVPLDVFVNFDDGSVLINQSTDTLGKENNEISYTVATYLNNDFLLKDENVEFNGSDFATFEITVKVDPNLEFATLNPDGTVTLQMESGLIIPQEIQTTGKPVPWQGTGSSWSVTFDPSSLPTGKDGTEIVIKAAFTEEKVSYSRKMTLTGLDFKLKDSAFDADGIAPQVNTSANIKAKIQLREITGYNLRFRFYSLEGLLGKNDADGKAWRQYFGGGPNDPTAYVHALQFLDYKLADYDLSTDTTARLKANTVLANGEFAITAMAGEHGSITPSGTVTVKRDDSASFTITPDSGYKIADVLVDGTSVGAVSSYTFDKVTANHTIEVTFQLASTGSSHTHNYVWQHSPDEHWQYCTECGSVVNNGPHTFQWKTDSNGNHYQECTVCGYCVSAAQTGNAGTSGTATTSDTISAPAAPASTAAANSAIPQTSDEMPVGALIALAAAAAVIFVALVVVRKRRQ